MAGQAARKRIKGKVLDAYLELIKQFPLTSIQSEEEFAAAQEFIDRLLAKGKLLVGEVLYLDALSDLVAAFEDDHYPIEPASDAEMLQHLMEAKGINQSELSRDAVIPKSTISEILSGKKNFSRSIIGKLANFFDVDKSVLTHNL